MEESAYSVTRGAASARLAELYGDTLRGLSGRMSRYRDPAERPDTTEGEKAYLESLCNFKLKNDEVFALYML